MTDDLQRAPDPCRGIAEYFQNARLLRDGERGDAGLEDAGLLHRDLLNGVAEDLRVGEGDAGDRGDLGRDDIGGVEPAAEADLDDGDVHGLLGEVEQAHRGSEFKEGGLAGLVGQIGRGVGDALRGSREVGVRDDARVDSDALADVDQVRAGVDADGVAARFEAAGRHLARAALALGSGDVHVPHGPVRVAEQVHEVAHAVEFEQVGHRASRAHALDIGAVEQPPHRAGKAPKGRSLLRRHGDGLLGARGCRGGLPHGGVRVGEECSGSAKRG